MYGEKTQEERREMHTEAMGEVCTLLWHCFLPALASRVHLKLQKILVSSSKRLKQGFIMGRTVYESFRWGDVYYSEELVVCACCLKWDFFE